LDAENFIPKSKTKVLKMKFEPVSTWALNSIRQTNLLESWFRSFEHKRRLPSLAEFEPLRAYPKPNELIVYDVVRSDGAPRYYVVEEGDVITTAFGFSAKGHFLNEVIEPRIWRTSGLVYDECVARRLPVYSVYSGLVRGNERAVFERLLLPFGHSENASVPAKSEVIGLVAALKSMAWTECHDDADQVQAAMSEPQYSTNVIITHG